MQIQQRPAIERALTRLTISQPWFASLALRLRVEENSQIPTAATNGDILYFNPKWFDSIDRKWQEAVWAHEVMHVCLLHMTRRNGRDASLWNIAGDHVINLELIESGFELPTRLPGICKGKCGIECCHMADPRFKGMTSEQVYSILKHEQDKKGGKGKGVVYVDQLGGPMDASGSGPEARSPEQLERDWQTAQEQATAVARMAGHLPGGAARLAHGESLPQVPWQDTVQKYLTAMGDLSWTRPNRRYIHRGLYLPGTTPGRPGPIVIAIDTSGSIDDKMLNYFASEVNGILSACGFPEKVQIIYCDASVQLVDEPKALPIALSGKGGGGTLAQPVFDWVAQNSEPPLVLFYLTDLELGDKPKDPGYDTVWITPKWSAQKAPFGELIQIDTGNL